MGIVFRTWCCQISQLRSLLPSGTPALTATSTHHVYDVITKSLQMEPLTSILLPPNHTIIRYSIEKVSRDIYKTFQWLVEDLIRTGSAQPKTLVFCRSISTCAALYKLFITTMREKSYEPLGRRQEISTRLFAMYHARVSEDDKQLILQSMLNPNGICRVLFCTTAFGMGVDVPNVRTIFHFGLPSDVDDYFQESGWAGRDGIESKAVLYDYPTCLIGHVSKAMREYYTLSEEKC